VVCASAASRQQAAAALSRTRSPYKRRNSTERVWQVVLCRQPLVEKNAPEPQTSRWLKDTAPTEWNSGVGKAQARPSRWEQKASGAVLEMVSARKLVRACRKRYSAPVWNVCPRKRGACGSPLLPEQGRRGNSGGRGCGGGGVGRVGGIWGRVG